MPIITESNGVKVIEFGTGDILMNDTRLNESEVYNGLCFIQVDEPREIDSTTQEFKDKKMSDVNAEVHFVFNKKASLKALMNSLTELYEQMPDDFVLKEV